MPHLLPSSVDLGWWLNRLRYSFASARQRRSIDGVEAEFVPETFREFRRFQSFTGEEPIISDMISQLSSDDTFYDIGANVGTHSCFAGQVAGNVVAFEPHPETARRLEDNLDRNGVSATTYQLALSDHRGTSQLVLPEETSSDIGSGEFSILETEAEVTSWTVDVIPGDSLIDRDDLPSPDVVKIDVEGAELQVIEGLSTALADARVVYCEVHPQHIDEEDVFDALRSLGFTVERLGTREGGHSFVRALRE
ncbi:methyltransferase, FkbM family [Natronoarchaeum philippinense]|uniref:Methyltransferase, FkbM family n=1 Tax=Natronoarchaeum philippinense TaxID=558529 RepID=A0A285NBB2_NATPI|nr:FkbM family methyltransferase [Natronoarchaeum philippinense]SNZ06774.1 methyltransferase, FkbM family [Natronoarchaeum philippinense]